MPGQRSSLFDAGDAAERLAESMLGSMAFVSPAPRQMDVGYDFFCVMKKREGKLNRATTFFTVQVKLGKRRVVFKTPSATAWIRHQENPHLIGAISRSSPMSLSLYSTAVANLGYRSRNARRIELVLDRAPIGTSPIQTIDPGPPTEPAQRQTIYLGDPILTMTVEDSMDESAVQRFRAVLTFWVGLERDILNRIQAELYFIENVPEYTTGEVPAHRSDAFTFMHNPQNFKACLRNYWQAAIALRVVSRRALGPDDVHDQQIGGLLHGAEVAISSDERLLNMVRGTDAELAREIALRSSPT